MIIALTDSFGSDLENETEITYLATIISNGGMNSLTIIKKTYVNNTDDQSAKLLISVSDALQTSCHTSFFLWKTYQLYFLKPP